MKTTAKWIYFIGLTTTIVACKKTDFLDKKPLTNILTPNTLTDFQRLLDNTTVIGYTGGISHASADEIVVSYADYQTYPATAQNAYIWAKDIYGGDVAVQDWDGPFEQIFYCNSVLEGLAKSDSAATSQAQYLKGWALFSRAYACYDLCRTFCKAYDANTAATDLGIPIRLKSQIDDIQQRSTLQHSFDQILNDLSAAASLLPSNRPSTNLNRPSKIAVYALLARISLDMRNYTLASEYADKAISLYGELIDYNSVSETSTTPFSKTNDELIYNGSQVTSSLFAFDGAGSGVKIPSNIIHTYEVNDMRLSIYFGLNTDGSYYKKRGYMGSGHYPFTGLATDELYLIKAECLARKGLVNDAMTTLNLLLIKRFKVGTFISFTANSPSNALAIILSERRKELIWRGLRWYDLKRLNKEGANITLTRVLNGVTYTLPPNDNRWVLPIPNDEIALSGIEQNPGR